MRLILLVLIFSSVFGAGVVDILFSDVLPLRPYTGIFRAVLTTSWTDGSNVFAAKIVDPNPIVTGLFHLFLLCLIIVSLSLLVSYPVPLIIGQHGKSQVSHTRYGKSKLTKRIIAKKILKEIRRTA